MAFSRVNRALLLLLAIGAVHVWAKTNRSQGTPLSSLSLEELDEKLQVSAHHPKSNANPMANHRPPSAMQHRPGAQPSESGVQPPSALALRLASFPHPLPGQPRRQRPSGDTVHLRAT